MKDRWRQGVLWMFDDFLRFSKKLNSVSVSFEYIEASISWSFLIFTVCNQNIFPCCSKWAETTLQSFILSYNELSLSKGKSDWHNAKSIWINYEWRILKVTDVWNTRNNLVQSFFLRVLNWSAQFLSERWRTALRF